MKYTIESIAEFTGGKSYIAFPGSQVSNVIIDHRDVRWQGAIFVAIRGSKNDGHHFIAELVEQGLRHFMVTDPSVIKSYEDSANFILVDDVVRALQGIASRHRSVYHMPIIGITGSNGKTIVKEWMNQLLEDSQSICRSPKSYNSQIGTALSVIGLQSAHTLGVFEVGISQPGEMRKLEQIVKPTLGVFTNLADAHAAHFNSDQQKFAEKWQLFDHSKQVICCRDEEWFEWLSEEQKTKCYTWSFSNEKSPVFVANTEVGQSQTIISLKIKSKKLRIEIPFTDRASIQNAITCFSAISCLGMLNAETLKKFEQLNPVAMRLELKQGIENTLLIDDTYNSDLGSLGAALEQLKQQNRERIVILSDIADNYNRYPEIAEMLKDASVTEFVGIGASLELHRSQFEPFHPKFFRDADTFWQQLDKKSLRNKAILVKGARVFQLDQLTKRLQAQQHETCLEVDLHKLGQNLSYFRSKLNPGVRVMLMVKAFGYGSGGFEVASYLQSQKVDYLAVAYADEGVQLRQRGIRTPIMVMSPTSSVYETMITHDLEPEVYSIRNLKEFIEVARNQRHLFEHFPIHIKLDSGMHRLGFDKADISELIEILKSAPYLKVASVFSHLSAADNEDEDQFSKEQISQFLDITEKLGSSLGTGFMRHVLNSTGILRFKDYQFDMVRIGIGLYGFAGAVQSKYLHALGAFKTYIVQIRNVKAQASVGYNRKGKHHEDRKIATIAVGYADGFDRRLGNGQWKVNWQGLACPIVGDVCMDMCMIDVTNTNAHEGDEIIVFSGASDILEMAKMLHTIPYEILTKISPRVRRVYLHE